MKPQSSNASTLTNLLPWLALLCSVLLFGLHFFAAGGRNRLINDSRGYLSIAQGERAGTPFDSRVFAPFIAAMITKTTGVSGQAAFQVLSFASLIGSLLLLKRIIRNRGGKSEYQAAMLFSLGAGLAATFGDTPVMIDPPLLVLACLTVLALDHGKWLGLLVLSVLAALTKEYGLLLGLLIALICWRNNRRKYAIAGMLLPVASLLFVLITGPRSERPVIDSWHNFINGMLGYHRYLLHFRGPVEYLELLYMWSWSVVWPVLVLAGVIVGSRLGSRTRMTDDQIGFALMLLALPLLLLGDWGRALLIVVPFACTVAVAHPLARDRYFLFLLGLGGLSTALARPLHSTPPPPMALTLAMTVISVAASVLIAVRIVRSLASRSTRHLDPAFENAFARDRDSIIDSSYL